MGVPRLFRFLSQRYPCLIEELSINKILQFDNLYLDMNGIIHQCVHSNSQLLTSLSEDVIFKNIFYYIEVLFNYVKPKKLLFLAVDGVAPQAKLNNQKKRRFMKAKERKMEEQKLLANNISFDSNRFDTNSISPGTPFMERLHNQLQYFVTSKISIDPLWQNIKVILSGHQTPGEGEHKIMDYMRYLRTQPDHDPSLRHCIFGSDADLMLLALSTHELNFFIIREKATHSKKVVKTVDDIQFQLINVPFLREYLDLEFGDLKEKLPFPYDLNNIVDDWILMTFLLGNDFIPNLPDLYIRSNALPILYKTYKEVMPTLEGYLNENGQLNLPRFQEFMAKLGEHDIKTFEEDFADLMYLESKMSKSLDPEKDENYRNSQKPDLEALIEATNSMYLSSDDEDDEFEGRNHDTFLLEFCQKKKNYYSNKLGLGEVTDAVLKSQAEGYIRAIQWNLYYYFQGCKSWNWFYPYHYSPYISDIINFKDCSLEFDLGQPLYPFEQLMAILPPSSKDNVPEVYHHLMTSPESPIIDFFPEDFETDQNGKVYDWEAVVLIPFTDQERLKEAMKPYNDQLTKEEKMRNSHGPMHVYTYTDKNLGNYKSPGYFPDVISNRAFRVDVLRSEIDVETSKLRFLKFTKNYSNSERSTLRHFPFSSSLKPIRAKIFEFPSKEDSLVLTLDKQNVPDLKELGKKILGKIIQVNWPNLNKAKVAAIASPDMKISLNKDGTVLEEILEKEATENWMTTQELLTEHYLTRKGIEIGETKILVYVRQLEGGKISFNKGKLDADIFWAREMTPWPYQTIVQNESAEVDLVLYKSLNDAFPVGSTVFMLDKSYLGAKGKVLDSSNCIQNGWLNVAFEVFNDIRTEKLLIGKQKTIYLPSKAASANIGITSKLFGRITGYNYIFDRTQNSTKVNIGLNMKFSRKNQELPGYTKMENNYWLYSLAAIKIVSEYLEAFPRVFEYLNEHLEDLIYIDEIFPEGTDEMEKMVKWVENQDYHKLDFIPSGSEIVDPAVIPELEKVVSNFKKVTSIKKMPVKLEHVYKSDLCVGKVPLTKGTKHCLYDRIVSIKSSYTVPTGLRGVIIGIQKTPVDGELYDILFDEPFRGAFSFYTTDNRVYKMPENYFINLTSPNRMVQKKPVVEVNSERNLQSAFAEFKQSKPENLNSKPVQILTRDPDKNKQNEEFKKMWSNLQNGKPQQETMVLKQLLKIDEGPTSSPKPASTSPKNDKDNVIGIVKAFFQNVKVPVNELPVPPKTAGMMAPPNIPTQPILYLRPDIPQASQPTKMPPNPYVQPPMPVRPCVSQGPVFSLPPTPSGYYAQLCMFYGQRNMPFPKYNSFRVNNKIVIQLICSDGRIFPSLAMDDQMSALESASRNALLSLGVISDATSQRDRVRHVQEVQNKSKSKSQAETKLKPDWMGDNWKSCTSQPRKDSNPARNSCLKTNVPQSLPLPPQQWVVNTPRKHLPFKEEHEKPQEKYQSPVKMDVKNNIQRKKRSPTGNQKVSTLDFVPLQAITGKRSFKPIATTQTAKSAKTNSNGAKIIKEMQGSKATLNTSKQGMGKNESTKPKTQRPRHRIAANLNLDPNLY